MADINAKQVQALRAKTDLPMMDCKQALVESQGDEKKALEILRKRFADKMSTRAEKETANGRIGVFADEKGVALAELRCETDFVANNELFKQLANEAAQQCARTGIVDVEQLKASTLASGRKVGEQILDAFGKFKENMGLHRLKRLEGPGACYVHHNGKIGTAIICDAPPGEAGRHICMHIASTRVILGVVREEADSAMVAEARDRAMSEIAGKPEQIKEKIVRGKMEKWYADRILTEQPFVMDDKKTVGAYAKENGFSIKAFIKCEVGGVN